MAPRASDEIRPTLLREVVWNTWRRHRLALFAMAAVFAGDAIVLLFTGLHAHAVHDSFLAHRCLTVWNSLCPQLLNHMGNSTWVLGYLPWLIAVFLGAPIAAREFDTGTFRFANTQGVSARRQLAFTLVILAAVVMAASAMLGLLGMWCQDPFLRAGAASASLSRWQPGYFQITAVTLPGWTLFALCLGLLAGTCIKRVVPAMAIAVAGLAVFASLSTGSAELTGWSRGGAPPQHVTLMHWLLSMSPAAKRGHTLQVGFPLGTFRHASDRTFLWPAGQSGPEESWQVGGWLAGPSGQRLSGAQTRATLGQIPLHVATKFSGVGGWLAARHITYWIGYQPASRYWPFQAAVAAILLALAIGAGSGAVWLVGRRR